VTSREIRIAAGHPLVGGARRQMRADTTISISDIVAAMPDSRSPLPPAAIHILLAIGPGERHGYGIMSEVAALTNDAVRLAPGTLYTNIKRLLAGGLIEESEERPDPDNGDQRRRYYRLTAAGQQVVVTEVARMEVLVAGAQPWIRGLKG
jgi:DNA-binding PadR family transcriptional regulator